MLAVRGRIKIQKGHVYRHCVCTALYQPGRTCDDEDDEDDEDDD